MRDHSSRVSAKQSSQGEDVHDYSVRLAGFLAWDEHLASLEQAERSADEPRSMGLEDVHIVDDATGEFVE